MTYYHLINGEQNYLEIKIGGGDLSVTNKYHPFSWKPSHIGNNEVISSILSIWEYDRIERLGNNQCKRLWCNFIFQGIDSTKSLDHVIRTKSMHIKRFRASTYKAHL